MRSSRSASAERPVCWRFSPGHQQPSTADLYATELRCHVLPAFAGAPLPDITRHDVQEWVVRHAYRAVFSPARLLTELDSRCREQPLES